MQITQTQNAGLKRSFAVIVAASDIAAKVEDEVKKVAPTIKMPGFRPGKVPGNLIRKMHGASLRQQALEASVQDATQQLLSLHGLRPALQPKVDITRYAADADLEFTVDLEILPDVPPISLDGMALERLVVPVTDADVEAALERLARTNKNWETAAEGHAAVKGDLVVMDYLGKIDGIPFSGGKGEDMQIELGTNGLIPGFEDALVGAKAGESRTIALDIPANYGSAEIAGKAATFDVTISAVKTAQPVVVDDALAEGFGLESLEKLREIMHRQVEREHQSLSRTQLKRKLLDALAAAYDFDVPTGMVEAEFAQIWQQLEAEIGDNVEEKAKLEAERADYHAIAVRRVRLGLLLSDVGQKNNIQITNQEMSALINQEAMRYPGQQQQVVNYFTQNAMAAAQLRAPLYEEKVVDFILDQITLTEREVSRAEIEAAIEAESDQVAAASPSLETTATDTDVSPKPDERAPDKTEATQLVAADEPAAAEKPTAPKRKRAAAGTTPVKSD